MIKSPHGTSARYEQGCDCEQCRCSVFTHGKATVVRVRRQNENTRKDAWTTEEKNYAKDAKLSNREVANRTGRSIGAVRQYRDRNGWRYMKTSND